MKKLKTGCKNDIVQSNINKIIESLCEPESYKSVYHRSHHDEPMPSIQLLGEIVELIRSVMFPGFYGNSEVKPETMRYYLGAAIDRVYNLFSQQIRRGFCFICAEKEEYDCEDCEKRANTITNKFMGTILKIRKLLASDVEAAFLGDPAASGYGETIFCYPSISALTNYRIAHELYKLDVPIIPRIITEMAHSETGIDIHPGAQIGERFFIDHGTGVVIGETCIIGNNVQLYQGVTLGAKSFPLDKNGNPIKGIPRHPVVEDDVIIYSGATILGTVTIGRGSIIGGNVWLTHDVNPGTRVVQGRAEMAYFENGSGI